MRAVAVVLFLWQRVHAVEELDVVVVGGARETPLERGVVVAVHVVDGLRDGDRSVGGERGDDVPRVGRRPRPEQRALARDAELVRADEAAGRVAAEPVARPVEEEADPGVAVEVVLRIDLMDAVPLDLMPPSLRIEEDHRQRRTGDRRRRRGGGGREAEHRETQRGQRARVRSRPVSRAVVR